MVSILIDCGSDVNGAEGNSQSTLSIAYSLGDREMVELLTAKGATVDLKHRVEGPATQPENFGNPVDVVRLLNESLFKQSFPSRFVEEED